MQHPRMGSTANALLKIIPVAAEHVVGKACADNEADALPRVTIETHQETGRTLPQAAIAPTQVVLAL